jgi:multidrug efflux pump subunit AcrB
MVAQFKSFKIAGVIMMTFLVGMFGIMPWFSLIYILWWEFFTAPSMIWVIALAWIVVWNAIILIEYLNLLLKQWYSRTIALIRAGQTRMRAIIITSLTTVLGSLTILWDPVWWGLGWSIVWWLSVSAVLTLIVIPIFLYDNLESNPEEVVHKIDETVDMDY